MKWFRERRAVRVLPYAQGVVLLVALAFALLLGGCSVPGQGVAFVVNRTGQASGQGKSYSFPTSTLAQKGSSLTLTASEDVLLEVSVASTDWVGKSFPLAGGRLRLEGKETGVQSGELSIQTLQSGTYRGNFNARLEGGLEAVGYFEARLTPPP